ncbi:MAG: glycerate kinase [Ginsengibacter sp.]
MPKYLTRDHPTCFALKAPLYICLMHIVIAPNAFKGSLTASEAANCIADGLKKSSLSCRLTVFPIADGGDGTAILISEKMESEIIRIFVHDPIGRKVEARFGWHAESQTGLIEMSEASGLRLLKNEELNPLLANTKGTGELIKAALDKGARKLIIGVGGSATVDGGAGLLRELGVLFLDENNNEIYDFPEGLLALKSIEISGLDLRLKDCEVVVLCDVENKLLGKKGAAAVFGPQKGANNEQVIYLENCLKQFTEVTRQIFDIDMDSIVHGGAAGGVAAALATFTQAQLLSGIDYFLDTLNFEKIISDADLIITGEGSLDEQTMEGKGPFGVAKKALKNNVPVVVMAGKIPLKINEEMRKHFKAIFSIGHHAVSLNTAIENTAADLKRTSCELGNLLALKNK